MADRPTFYGKYQGVVVNVLDPERRGRILVQVPAVYKDSVSGWAVGAVAVDCQSTSGAVPSVVSLAM